LFTILKNIYKIKLYMFYVAIKLTKEKRKVNGSLFILIIIINMDITSKLTTTTTTI
jgi:hypothetical protein